MGISKNYQKALMICSEQNEFTILKYIKGKSPKIELLCNNCGERFERYLCHFIQYPHVCPKCHPKGRSQQISVEEGQKRTDAIFGENKILLIDYKGNNTLSTFKCADCGEVFSAVPTSIWRGRSRGCPKCTKSESLGENKVEKFLRENKIHFRRQERFPDCKDTLMLPFDFYLPQYNICIEFQGEQHYKKRSLYWDDDIIRHETIKKQYCEKNNIKLIEIPYWDMDNIPSYFSFIRE